MRHDMLSPFQDAMTKEARETRLRGCAPRNIWCAPFCVRSPASTARITASWRQQRPLSSILYLFLQKSMIKGLTACAIKG